MGRFEKKKRRSKGPLIFLIVAVVLVGTVIGIAPKVASDIPDATESITKMQTTEMTQPPEPLQTTAPESETTPPAASGGQAQPFPVFCADGRLEIQSLLQYGGINPDCDNQEGNDVAAIMVCNVSGEYLKEAQISLKLTDGITVNFMVTELPAGAEAIAFSRENQTIKVNAEYAEITCEAQFGADGALTQEQMKVSVEGTLITLTNTSAEDWSEIVVYCRSPLGEEYFGGMAYEYTIEQLPAGESATIDAWDCILGEAEVMRITAGKRE